MTQSEQIPFENYKAGQIKFYILEVKRLTKDLK